MSRLRREKQAERRGEQPGKRRSAVRVIEALLWLVVAALFVWRVTPQLQAAVGWHSGGAAAPAVTLDMLDGEAVPLHRLEGQVVLVNFWATWCPPCRAELPGLESVYEAKHPDGFTIVGISMDQIPRAAVASFLQQHDIRYPVAMASPEVVAAFGGVNSFPTSFLLDREGRVRYTVHGMFASPALRAAVNRLLAERS